MSQPAVAEHINKGLLKPGLSLFEWLHAYSENLREKAAGRGGEDQAALTRARTIQAQADGQLKELNFHREVKNLVPVDEIEPMLETWATVARSEFQNAINKLIAGIESKHKIQVDAELIDEIITLALASIGNYPRNIGGHDGEGGGEIQTTQETINA